MTELMKSRAGLGPLCGVLLVSALLIVGCGSETSTSKDGSTESTSPTTSVNTEPEPVDTEDSAVQEIEDLNGAFADAFAAKDAKGVCALMSPQAVAATEGTGNTCEETVPLGFALVGREEIDRISNPVDIKINGDRAVIEYESGDPGFADLVDGEWMIGQ